MTFKPLKNSIIILIIASLALCLFSSCSASENIYEKILLIEFNEVSDVSIKAGEESKESYFKIKGKENDEFAIETVDLISEDESIAKIIYTKTDLEYNHYYKIIAQNTGETSFYIKTKDEQKQSPKIKVIVTDKISSIELPVKDDIILELEQNSAKRPFYIPGIDEINIEEIAFVSENEQIATIQYDDESSSSSKHFKVNSVSSGETYVYLQTINGNVKSEKIKVIVKEKVVAPTSDQNQNENPITEPPPTSQQTTTKGTDTGSETKTPSTQEQPSNGNNVYVTPSGKRYHLSSSCAGKNATATSKDSAIGKGYTPCKKCAQ